MTTQAQTATITDSPGAQKVYDFAEGSREMRDLLGGKGAGAVGLDYVSCSPFRLPIARVAAAQAAIAAPRQTRL
jgi:phosphoenolpyruvate synthase/pyruvate phosphate dikinase